MVKFKFISDLSLRRFFLYTIKFCAGFNLSIYHDGRVKLVSYSLFSNTVYESKIYSSYDSLRSALSRYINKVLY